MDAASSALALSARPLAQPDRWADRFADRLAWTALVVLAGLAALTFRSYGLGWDDFTHSQYGDLLLSLYGSGFRDTRAFSFVNLYMYGGGFDMVAQGLARLLPFDPFETRRLVGAAVGIVGIAITWRIARRIGGPVAGVIALILLAACPLYYGHMFINAKDTPFAVAMAFFLLGLVRLLDEYPKPSRPTLLIVGAGFGLAIGSRIMAGFGVFEALFAFGLLYAIEAKSFGGRFARARLGAALLALIPSAVLAYIVMALVWPWSVTEPLNPLRAVEYFSHFFEKPWRELFQGELILTINMPRRYAPVLFGVRLPELFLALSLAGLIGALLACARPALAPRQRAILLAVALAALLPVAATVIGRPAMYNGIRHFVFVMPPLAVLGGLAGAWIIARAAAIGRPALLGFAAILAIGIALPVVAMARLHPFEYAHYNNLVGGARHAQHRFMLDYWGLSFKPAAQKLHTLLAARDERPPPGQHWRTAVCGPHSAASVALGDQFDPTWEIKGADFALQLGTFYCAQLDAPVLVEIVRDGIVFARVYDVRGRTLRSIYTYPEVVGE